MCGAEQVWPKTIYWNGVWYWPWSNCTNRNQVLWWSLDLHTQVHSKIEASRVFLFISYPNLRILSQVLLLIFVNKTRQVTWTLVIVKGNGISGLVISPTRNSQSFALNALTIMIAISMECVIRIAKNVNAMETFKTAYSIWVSLSGFYVFIDNVLFKISGLFSFWFPKACIVRWSFHQNAIPSWVKVSFAISCFVSSFLQLICICMQSTAAGNKNGQYLSWLDQDETRLGVASKSFFSFLFCAKTKKQCWQKYSFANVMKKHVRPYFSPAGKNPRLF